jgi:CRP-like cAMP-binding protein
MDYELKRQLHEQSGGIPMSDELFELFVGRMTEIHLKNKEVLIPYGKIDTNLYLHRSGILRACYFVGENEKTYGFAEPGTLTVSYHSYCWHKPSVFQIESCGESTVLKMTRKQLEELLDSSHEFTKWLLSVRTDQLCFHEFKLTNISGDAKDRYLWMLKNRPDVVAQVPDKVMASYLGVGHTYLSRLRRTMWRE